MSQTILTPEVLDRLKQLDDAGEMYAIINTILDFINDGIEKVILRKKRLATTLI